MLIPYHSTYPLINARTRTKLPTEHKTIISNNHTSHPATISSFPSHKNPLPSHISKKLRIRTRLTLPLASIPIKPRARARGKFKFQIRPLRTPTVKHQGPADPHTGHANNRGCSSLKAPLTESIKPARTVGRAHYYARCASLLRTCAVAAAHYACAEARVHKALHPRLISRSILGRAREEFGIAAGDCYLFAESGGSYGFREARQVRSREINGDVARACGRG